MPVVREFFNSELNRTDTYIECYITEKVQVRDLTVTVNQSLLAGSRWSSLDRLQRSNGESAQGFFCLYNQKRLAYTISDPIDAV